MPDGAPARAGRLEPLPARGHRPRRGGRAPAWRRRDVPQRDRRGLGGTPDPASTTPRATASSCSSRRRASRRPPAPSRRRCSRTNRRSRRTGRPRRSPRRRTRRAGGSRGANGGDAQQAHRDPAEAVASPKTNSSACRPGTSQTNEQDRVDRRVRERQALERAEREAREARRARRASSTGAPWLRLPGLPSARSRARPGCGRGCAAVQRSAGIWRRSSCASSGQSATSGGHQA